MSDIKQQFQIARIAIFMTKAEDLNAHRSALAVRTEARQKVAAQRVNGVFRSIDDLISKGTNARHGRAFGADRLQQALSFVSRVGPSGLTKTMLQNIIRRFEEENINRESGRP